MIILIGGAWPYANGSLHIGHIAGLLPGDVIARYHRAIGNEVFYVSGSDCHGTPVTIRAKQEGKTPREISDKYHQEFTDCFIKLGFQYDLYGKTSQQEHIDFVQKFHEKLYHSKYVYKKTVPQAYCETCNQFLPDRFVVGKCPKCSDNTRGDQCDRCGTVLEPEQLTEPVCSICGTKPVFKDAKHLYIGISKLHQELKELVDSHPNWRKNAIAFTNRYIDEGLRDRAITRDLDWGIEVPKAGYDGKKIYIWAENVLGYLSMSAVIAKERGVPFKTLWGKDTKHYYIHAKDNIPFHTIILPSLLIAHGEGYHLPDEIISNEYLTLEGRKISTSQNWAIWVKDIIDRYNPDSIRYFLLANGPEKRDTDFTWNEFVNSNNSDLVGVYGNFINRTIVFIQKYFDSVVPEGYLEEDIKTLISDSYHAVGNLIDKGSLKDAIQIIIDFARYANKFFDTSVPWITRNTNVNQCKHTIYNCIQIIANLAVLFTPFLPFSSHKVKSWLNLSTEWKEQYVEIGYQIPETTILFERLDKEVAEEEKRKLSETKLR